MTEPTRVLFGGDTHGDLTHIAYYYAMAKQQNCDAVFVLGDFGFWEHTGDGARFLDGCSLLATGTGIPLYWLDGNHENHTLLRERYLDDPVTVDEWGFVEMRPGLYHAPRALRWTWGGQRFMALGGAYSIDKEWRLNLARDNKAKAAKVNAHRTSDKQVDLDTIAYWWPEEEISDEEVAQALAGEAIDVLLVHDKPIKSKPPWNRKDYEECLPNQQRIQKVVDRLHPWLLLHGHLHLRYTDIIGSYWEQDADGLWWATQVEGLDCNESARINSGYPYTPEGSWWVLDLTKADHVVHSEG